MTPQDVWRLAADNAHTPIARNDRQTAEKVSAVTQLPDDLVGLVMDCLPEAADLAPAEMFGRAYLDVDGANEMFGEMLETPIEHLPSMLVTYSPGPEDGRSSVGFQLQFCAIDKEKKELTVAIYLNDGSARLVNEQPTGQFKNLQIPVANFRPSFFIPPQTDYDKNDPAWNAFFACTRLYDSFKAAEAIREAAPDIPPSCGPCVAM